ncbi:hypothetical protein RHP47_01145 [Thermosynechococcus sp. QKsg1]|uniref:hypothetical protein n=1 Tax=Thermosynechococcus sp. QKsg1 TaxID=3074130 RepID=UPI0028772E09|nr:hypothetical protein [Thermosynechococcus sp. QKsg1]WNC86948.1 hypothetical protein RHP47_01145 [Thermosynechococcus sp. QKsg1]
MFEVCLFSMLAEMLGITLSEVLGVALGHLMITVMSQAIAHLREFSPFELSR